MVAGADSIADMAIAAARGDGDGLRPPVRTVDVGIVPSRIHLRARPATRRRRLAVPVRPAPIGPRWSPASTPARVLVDIDDTIIEVHGHGKQGSGYGYSGVRGLNALIATVTTDTRAPVIVGQRLRRGACGSPRGAARMVADALATVDRLRAAATGTAARCGCGAESLGACRFGVLRASHRAGRDPRRRRRVGHRAPDRHRQTPRSPRSTTSAWTPIEYTDAVYDEDTDTWISRAEVAEIDFTAFASQQQERTRSPGGWWCAASPTCDRRGPRIRARCSTSGGSTPSSPPPTPTTVPSPPTKSTVSTPSSSRCTRT